MNTFPSIFNDVIGPIMRGPSSSHCAAATRIGLLARALMGGDIESVRVEFDKNGSLAMTHDSQGSDMGLCGGLLGFDISDERLVRYRQEIQKAGIRIEFRIDSYGDLHPNTYRLSLQNAKEQHRMVALSTGGGMLEIVEIDGHGLSIMGDRYETLVFFEKNDAATAARVSEILDREYAIEVLSHPGKEKDFIRISSPHPVDGKLAAAFENESVVVKILPPVLPILTPEETNLPFVTCGQMLSYNEKHKLDLARLAINYESARGAVSPEDIIDRMIAIVRTIKKSVQAGLAGTRYRDRILGCQSSLYHQKRQSGQLIDVGVLNRVILYVTALMEVKSAMGVIVAAPTAGSCGGLPGAVLGVADEKDCEENEIAKALLAAGMIGIFIAKSATFAAEVAGCQAECGAGSAMAAAGLVTLMGGAAEVAVAAASMALQNVLGLICDPVAGRVEVPCLGKNVMAAGNAVSCANMALAGYDQVIPLDEVILAMDDVGKSLPSAVKCTARGGLSVTETSQKIQASLWKNPGR